MDKIRLYRVRHHNLKGFDLEIPRQGLTVICGPSGSGKSTLAVDILYAEGRRRYLEALNLSQVSEFRELEAPDIEGLEGIPAPVVVTQGAPGASRRSTVGTVSGLYDLLRHLFAWAATAHCLSCGHPLEKMTLDEIVSEVMALPEGSRLEILAPMMISGDIRELAKRLLREGFLRIRLGEELIDLSEGLPKGPCLQEIRVVIDRLIIKEGIRGRLADSVRLALELSQGFVEIWPRGEVPLRFSLRWLCPRCRSPFPEVIPALFSFNQPYGACPQCQGLGEVAGETCSGCQGRRLSAAALSVYLAGKDIAHWSGRPLEVLGAELEQAVLGVRGRVRREVAKRLVEVLKRRITPLVSVGLGHLSLFSSLALLSRGEAGRLKIASALGQGLTGILFVLDEPTVGLSSKEQEKLLSLLKGLKEAGNTLVIVEHELSFIQAADWVVELGPGAGPQGGHLLYSGPPQGLVEEKVSPTGDILRKGLCYPKAPSVVFRGKVSFKGLKKANLRLLELSIPLGLMTAVIGPSGSGKTTLLEVILEKLERGDYQGPPDLRAIIVDQALPEAGRASFPVTYIGAFDEIRRLFAQTPEARMRGYRPGHFSLSVKGGRCEACRGLGYQEIGLTFMPAIRLVCGVCQGRRFGREILEIRYRGLNIAEVLDLTVTEALAFFGRIPAVCDRLRLLERVGLGYLQLGQPLVSLSGGERQRLKLARYLVRSGPQMIFLLDEPSAGLHPQDLVPLIRVFWELLEAGASIVIAEHDQFLVEQAHYVVELGPGAGEEGGRLVGVRFQRPV
ncbi:hypothetical protein [Thermosulfuriphilus sp.]